MRARTRRLRSLLTGIVISPLDAPRRSPQQRAMVTQRTDETNPGVCPPLPLIGLRLGQSLKRLGADRRREHDVIFGRRRQVTRTFDSRPNRNRLLDSLLRYGVLPEPLLIDATIGIATNGMCPSS